MILEIGGTDYSDYVNKRNYKANKVDETTSWKDANSVIHTTVLRTRISAEIELDFLSEEDHTDFIDDVADSCVDGYWTVSLHVNNTHDVETITARIDMTAKAVFGNALVNGAPIVNAVTLSIEEV